ncbi:dipeptidase PepV [Desnuesiella massiliensis]|uniref:dipeptidase PepV n=1 Tax=Desnuesiella massiliensis TaxID=1650662 RepID=UPI0006E2AAA6|nr:dipeptidase PepV [Desnuesiella massiliensis]
MDDDKIKAFKLDERFLEDLFKILKIDSVKSEEKAYAPYGEGIALALKEVLEIAESYGFTVKNLDNHIGYAEYGEGEDYIGVLGHIDVVPANDYKEAFNPKIEDGKLYARGALDDKGPILTALYALKLLKDNNIKLNKKVRIIFGCNEESGDSDILYYLKAEKPPIMCFTPDAYFPIVFSEKGILTFLLEYDIKETKGYSIVDIRGGTRSNIVPDKAIVELGALSSRVSSELHDLQSYSRDNKNIKVIENRKIDDVKRLNIESLGKAAHGSTPYEGVNAISNLFMFLNNNLCFRDSFGDFLEDFSFIFNGDFTGERLGILHKDNILGNLTVNLGIVSFNHGKISLRLNIRYPNSITYEQIYERLEDRIRSTGFKLVKQNHLKPLFFEEQSPLIEGLKRAYESEVKEKAELLAVSGGTYAKLMPNTVAFGPLFKDDINTAHEKDEFIEIASLEKALRIYARALVELSK